MTDEILNSIILQLQIVSYVSMSGAFIFGCIKAREIKIFDRILLTTTLAAFVTFYNPIMDEGTKIFEKITVESDSKIDLYLEKCRTIRFKDDSGFFDDFITSLQANFFKLLLSCTYGLRFISGMLQTFFIVAFKILAPVIIGLGAWDQYRTVLLNFITYSLATMMWSIGYQIADVFVLNGIILIGIPSALSAGAGAVMISGGTALLGIIVFLITLFIGMCIFYILTPIIMFSVLSGANPGMAVMGNMRTSAIASMAASKPVGMIIQKTSAGIVKAGQKVSGYGRNPGNRSSGGVAPAVSLNSVTQAMGKRK